MQHFHLEDENHTVRWMAGHMLYLHVELFCVLSLSLSNTYIFPKKV